MAPRAPRPRRGGCTLARVASGAGGAEGGGRSETCMSVGTGFPPRAAESRAFAAHHVRRPTALTLRRSQRESACLGWRRRGLRVAASTDLLWCEAAVATCSHSTIVVGGWRVCAWLGVVTMRGRSRDRLSFVGAGPRRRPWSTDAKPSGRPICLGCWLGCVHFNLLWRCRATRG